MKPVDDAAPPAAQRPRRRRSRKYHHPLIVLAFIGPCILLVGILRVWPVFESFRLAFTDYDGMSKATYVGLDNFVKLVKDEVFWNGLLVNLKLLLAVPVLVVVPLLIAALLQSRAPGWQAYRAIYFLPTLLSPTVIALTFRQLLNIDGGVNTVLRAVGLDGWATLWLQSPTWALIWVIIVGLWAGLGISVVILMAGMGSVDTDLIDAARIDGANWLSIQRHVVFWQILPIIELVTVLSLIGVFTGWYPLILLLTNGGPDYATTPTELYAFQLAFDRFEFGYSSAVNVAIFLIVVVAVSIMFRLFRRRRIE